jgi:hypothetical protein
VSAAETGPTSEALESAPRDAVHPMLAEVERLGRKLADEQIRVGQVRHSARRGFGEIRAALTAALGPEDEPSTLVALVQRFAAERDQARTEAVRLQRELEEAREQIDLFETITDTDAYRLAAGITCVAGQSHSCGDAHHVGRCYKPTTAESGRERAIAPRPEPAEADEDPETALWGKGCPVQVWPDGMGPIRCGAGGDRGTCATHGEFAKKPKPAALPDTNREAS